MLVVNDKLNNNGMPMFFFAWQRQQALVALKCMAIVLPDLMGNVLVRKLLLRIQPLKSRNM